MKSELKIDNKKYNCFTFPFTETRYLDKDEASSGCAENRKCQTQAKVWSSWKRAVTKRLRTTKGAGNY